MLKPLLSTNRIGSYFGPVLLLSFVLVIVEWLFLRYGLSYDPLTPGDAADYWKNSLGWRASFEPFHLPAYSWAIAAVRVATGGVFAPQAIMLSITLACFSVAILAVYRIIQVRTGPDNAWAGALAVALFVLWPMAGTTYVAIPIADMFSTAPLLLGGLLLLYKRPLPAAVLLGLAIVSHKGMWPFAALLMAGHLFTARTAASLIVAGVMALPIAILWLLGSIYNDSFAWIVSSDIDFALRTETSLPVLDGVVTSFRLASITSIGKAVLVLGQGFLALMVILRARNLPNTDGTKWFSFSIALGILISILILNERELWSVVRFGRVLAIPLVLLYGTDFIRVVKAYRGLVYGVGLGLLGLFGSQLAFAYYLARIWTWSPPAA